MTAQHFLRELLGGHGSLVLVLLAVAGAPLLIWSTVALWPRRWSWMGPAAVGCLLFLVLGGEVGPKALFLPEKALWMMRRLVDRREVDPMIRAVAYLPPLALLAWWPCWREGRQRRSWRWSVGVAVGVALIGGLLAISARARVVAALLAEDGRDPSALQREWSNVQDRYDHVLVFTVVAALIAWTGASVVVSRRLTPIGGSNSIGPLLPRVLAWLPTAFLLVGERCWSVFGTHSLQGSYYYDPQGVYENGLSFYGAPPEMRWGVVLTGIFISGLAIVTLVRRRQRGFLSAPPSRRSRWVALGMLGIGGLAFAGTRRFARDAESPLPFLLPGPLLPSELDLPRIWICSEQQLEGPVVEVRRDGVFLNGSPIRDPEELKEQLRNTRDLWRQSNVGQDHPGFVIFAVDRSTPIDLVAPYAAAAARAQYRTVGVLHALPRVWQETATLGPVERRTRGCAVLMTPEAIAVRGGRWGD